MNSDARSRLEADPKISAEAIHAQATKIVTSRPFADSERLRRFLKYTVEETLNGHGEQIKEYSIGVEGSGREESFDPRTDPIVRVQAGFGQDSKGIMRPTAKTIPSSSITQREVMFQLSHCERDILNRPFSTTSRYSHSLTAGAEKH